MVAASVPIFDVAKILGHSTLQVTMRYAHFAPEAGRAAIEALERKLRPPEAPDHVGEGCHWLAPSRYRRAGPRGASRHRPPHCGAREPLRSG
jgi:hypothetical protein